MQFNLEERLREENFKYKSSGILTYFKKGGFGNSICGKKYIHLYKKM